MSAVDTDRSTSPRFTTEMAAVPGIPVVSALVVMTEAPGLTGIPVLIPDVAAAWIVPGLIRAPDDGATEPDTLDIPGLSGNAMFGAGTFIPDPGTGLKGIVACGTTMGCVPVCCAGSVAGLAA